MSKKEKTVIYIVTVVLVAALAVIVAQFFKPSKAAEEGPIMLNETIVINGLELQDLCAYSGKFVEDGSDEAVSNILAAKIKNCTVKDLEYAELELVYGGEMYTFSVSALPAGATALVLETNKAECPEVSEEIQANLLYTVFFEEKVSMSENAIKVIGGQNSITITNITETDINGKIIVCYKNVEDGEYLGGIAYRASVPNGLAAGESVALSTNHYNPETCEIIFVSYGE